MRMSDSETMNGSSADEGQLHASQSQPHEENCSADRTEAQRQTPGPGAKRPKSNTKVKLVRSLAICEDPCPSTITTQLPQDQQDGDHIKVSQTFDKEELPLAADEDDADRSANKMEKTPRKMLSRDSSQEYKDSTGIDLHGFLVNTLKNIPRDRVMLLQLEQDILDFISNNESQRRKFPPMTSYHRMLLHRVAAYFGLEHNVDQTGKCVVINRTSSTRIPDQKFSEHIKDVKMDELQKRFILKRDNSSTDRDDSVMRMKLKEDRRSKSIEEREEEYQRARERIFSDGLDTFPLDKRIQEDEVCNSIQQRRQIFRLKDSRSGNSLQSSSENDGQCSEPRPWSSTDSDSSNLSLKPSVTKASSFSSFSGVPVLSRGDSSSSSKSTGRLSNTGSDSCSSVGSSTGSLSRPQPPPAAAALRQPPAFSSVSASSGVSYEPPASTASASYYLLPLEAAGIPAGSLLVNTHTGQPFLNPDGSAVVYSPSVTSQASRCQSSVAPPPAAQHTNHVMAQPLWSVQPPPQSYPPVQPFTLQDRLSAQFGHMMLAQQASGDGRDAHAVVYPPPHQTGYVMSSPAVSTVSQQQQQMPACYCSPGQFPVSGQQYRPVGSVVYSGQSQMPPAATQPPGYQTVMPSQQQSHQNMIQTQTQHSSVGHQLQGMMVQYPPAPAYQASVPQQTYQQPVQVYYSILPPNQQNTGSSSVGLLSPPGAQQMSYHRTSPPSGSQHCSGAPPPAAGSMVMMHLALPPSHPALQWKHNRCYSSSHSHSQKPSDVCGLEPSPSSPQLGSSSSPTQSHTQTHLSNVMNIRPSLNTVPIMPHFSRSLVSAQGDLRCPLLGHTLQIHPPLLQAPPMVSSQAPAGVRPVGRGRRTPRRALSSDLS
ncbi:R3H domain-containing protein 1 isoform X1 [Carassius gibelio]|uniref:R3H domain-containing protein 1 isoform X1 n=1 Tax=Carassius gibelio TaxID=101364 RepID=UPI0022793FF9|nr:R3H domain-containing protein 1 isoform X1 [Carassius gibelio]XP_052462544.1 R3H domain-containing protein 1 isoform X1 [Carassius gibelio]